MNRQILNFQIGKQKIINENVKLVNQLINVDNFNIERKLCEFKNNHKQ